MSGTADAGRLLVRIEATTAQLRQQLTAAEQQVAGTSRKIDGDLKRADQAFNRLDGASKGAQQAVAGLTAQMGPLGRSLGSVTHAFSGATMAAGGLSTALFAVGAAAATGLTAAIQVAEKFERLSLRTEAIVRATGGAAGVSAQEIRNLSQEIARSTLASTANVEEAAQKLLTFRNVAGDTFGRTLKLAQDLAEVGFGSIDGAAVQLGKALESPAEGLAALTRVGVSFSASQKKVIADLVETGQTAEAQKVILDALEKQVGGTGEAASQGLAGAFDTLSMNVEEFLKRIGNTGPIQTAIFAVRQLAQAVDGLNMMYDAARNFVAPPALMAANAQVTASGLSVQRSDERLAQMRGRGLSDSDPRVVVELERQRRLNALHAEALANRQALEDAANAESAARQQKANAFRLESERESQAATLKVIRESLLPREKLKEEHEKRLAAIAKSVRLADPNLDQAELKKLQAETKMLEDLEKERYARAIASLDGVARAHARVAKEAADADAHVKTYLKAQEEAAKAVAKAQEKAAREIERFHERSFDAVASIGERAFDRVGDAMVQAFVSGEGAAVNFGGVLRGVIASALADLAKLAVVNPILNSIFVSSSGLRPTLAGAMAGGGGGGFSGFGGIGSMLSGGWDTLSSGGYLAGGGGFSGMMFGTPAMAPGGYTSAGSAATSGMFGAGGNFSMGSLGATLGGIGAGFGIGSTIGGFVANSGPQRQNSQIGAAVGSTIGAVFGPLGSIIGGALGGAAGGMIGPKDTVNAWGYWLESQDGQLAPINRQWYNEAGAQQFAYADQQVAATNAMLQAAGLTVSGSRNVGGNKNGPDGRWGGAGTFEEAFADLRFRATDNAQLDSALSGRGFAGAQALAEFVEGFLAIEAVIKALTADAVPGFTASINAVNDNFAAVREEANRLGASMDGLADAQLRAITEIEDARTEMLRSSVMSLEVRRLRAIGETEQAELLAQTEAANAEIRSFTASLDSLAIEAEDKANRLLQLEEVQAAERAAIVARWGEQANSALRRGLQSGESLMRDLAFGAASPLAPEQQYFAAMTTLNQARQALESGGSLSDYTTIASQVLPVARDYLGTSQRYGGLVSEIGQVLARNGADGAGLSQILTAQVQSTDAMGATLAALGSRQVDELVELRREVGRLGSALEALISRRQAA